jgi:hypothetical protein
VHTVDASILRHVNEISNPQIASLRGISWVYDTRLLEQSFQDLEALDLSSQHGDLMLFWEPPSLDMRIASQSGLLSMMNSGTASQSAFLQKHSQNHPDLVLRIIIDSAMKAQARDMAFIIGMAGRKLKLRSESGPPTSPAASRSISATTSTVRRTPPESWNKTVLRSRQQAAPPGV